jgi:ubiquitin-protein ligase
VPALSEERFQNELKQLWRLKKLLDRDTVLPLRIEITPKSLNKRRFELTIRGVTSLTGTSQTKANKFNLMIEVPMRYPEEEIPNIRFLDPKPFHPHVWEGGAICWGSGSSPQYDLFLVDWVRSIVEYLQYNQHQGSLLRINTISAANKTAMQWWVENARRIPSFVPPIDLNRLRYWINQSRG